MIGRKSTRNRLLDSGMLSICALITFSCAGPNAKTTVNASVGIKYTATTPCNDATKLLLNIPQNDSCEMMRWDLTLNEAPTTYKLTIYHGLAHQGTTGIIDGGKKIEKEGNWKKTIGRKEDNRATLYLLDQGDTLSPITLVELDPNLLHLLDSDKRLMIGNGAWSYSLNRVK